jgi:basic membrane protein A
LKLKNASAAFALLGASALVLSGCAAAPEEEPAATSTATATEEPAAETIDFLACAVSDEGSWNDKSFNESTYDGLEAAQSQLGVQIDDAESNTPEEFTPNLEAMVAAGCDITFAVGFGLADPVNLIAEANPDMNFVSIDGYSAHANLKPLLYNMAESSYLAGYLAASYSTTKVVSTYGGIPIPAVTDFMDGFYYGAMAWGMENDVEVTVVGWDPVAMTGDFMG